MDIIYRHRRLLGLILIMLLTLYPAVELTRVIVVAGPLYFPQMQGKFVYEIVTLWVMYLLMIPVYLWITADASKRLFISKRH